MFGVEGGKRLHVGTAGTASGSRRSHPWGFAGCQEGIEGPGGKGERRICVLWHGLHPCFSVLGPSYKTLFSV